MFPNRSRITVPVIIRKTGEKFIPNFPVELKEGDQIIICKKMMGWQAPEGKITTINGYTENGPIINEG